MEYRTINYTENSFVKFSRKCVGWFIKNPGDRRDDHEGDSQ